MYQCCRLTNPLSKRSYVAPPISDSLRYALSLQRCALPPTAQVFHMQLVTSAHPDIVTDYGAGTPLVTAVYPALADHHLAGSLDGQGSAVAGLFRSGLSCGQQQPPCLHTAAVPEDFTEPASELGPLHRRTESCLPVFTAVTQPLTAPSLAVQHQQKEYTASQDLATLTASGINRFEDAEKPRHSHSHQTFGHHSLHWCVTPSSQPHLAFCRNCGRLLHRK